MSAPTPNRSTGATFQQPTRTALVRRNSGPSKPRYQVHRAVDGQSEVITATEVTSGEINEAHRLEALVDQHHDNTHRNAETVVADSKYGTCLLYTSDAADDLTRVD